MTSAYVTQDAFRGRNDDGSESAASWIDLLNYDWTQPVDTTFRLRFNITESNGKNITGENTIYASYNGGTYFEVGTATSYVKLVPSSYVADDALTTQQLTSNSFVAGRFDSNGVISNVVVNGESTEMEYCLQIVGADVSDNDTISFRVYNSDTALNAYTSTPTVTASVPAAYNLPVVSGAYTLTGSAVTLSQNLPPATPTLSSPANTGEVNSVTPSFEFSTTDPDGDDVEYQVQIDTVNTFNSVAVLNQLDSDYFGGNIISVWRDANFIYVGAYDMGLHTYSVDVDGVLTHIDSDDQGAYANGVWGDGNFIYLANHSLGLQSYSVDGSGYLTLIDTDDLGDFANYIWGDGNFLYLGNNTGGIHTYSVDGSGYLTHIDSDDQGDSAGWIWGDGNFIYLANGTGGIHTYSVDGSGYLTHIDSDDQGGLASGIWGDGNFIYLGNNTGGLLSYSVDGSGYLTLIDTYNDDGLTYGKVWGDGTYLYVTANSDGLHVFSVDGSGYFTHLDSDDQGSAFVQGVYGDETFIYVAYGALGLCTYEILPNALMEFDSSTDAGFENLTTPADTHPFNEGDTIQFTVQAGDELTDTETYYWRVRAIDPDA